MKAMRSVFLRRHGIGYMFGCWYYFYQVVDSTGQTIDFLQSAKKRR
jgi:hypothetical protein